MQDKEQYLSCIKCTTLNQVIIKMCALKKYKKNKLITLKNTWL